MKYLFLMIISVLLLSVFMVNESSETEQETENNYYGPVPIGYDTKLFIETGITKYIKLDRGNF